MNTYTTFDRMYMLLTEALEGVYLDPEQTLYPEPGEHAHCAARRRGSAFSGRARRRAA